MTASTVGVAGFIASLARCGVTAEQHNTVITFTVEAGTGPLAGQHIPTGVTTDELAAWPACPPHWVHLPETITFAHTNLDRTAVLPGWVRHSRQINGWGTTDATEPGQAWLAHVRGVLTQAAA